jgi:Domain of unknown function (DUF4412)
MRNRLLFVLPIAALFSVPAYADFRATYRATQGDGGGLGTIEVAGGKMRMNANDTSVIFDVARKEYLVIDHKKREYLRMDEASIESMSAAVKDSQAQLNAAMERLPPEQRAMIEKQMAARMPAGGAAMTGGPKAVVDLKATGSSAKVAGYACEVYEVRVNGERQSESCLADAKQFGASAADTATVKQAMEFGRAMSSKISGGLVSMDFNAFNADRFPVRMVRYDRGAAAGTSELQEVSASLSLPASEFTIPAGYQERQLPKMPHH